MKAEILYAAYEQVASTPEREDVSCGLAIAAERCGHTFEDGEMQEYRSFMGRHTKELSEAYQTGDKDAFFSAVAACEKADNLEAEEVRKEDEE